MTLFPLLASLSGAHAASVELLGATASVTATSELASPKSPGAYAPTKLFDGDLTTAWSEGAKGLGEGSKIIIEWSAPMEIDGFAFVPGYGKSAELFEKNATPDALQVVLDHKALPAMHIGYRVALDMTAEESDQPSNRPMGCYPTQASHADPWRIVVFPETRKVTRLDIVVDSGNLGTKWDDLLISEVVLFNGKGTSGRVPKEVLRAIDVVGELRDGKSPASVFAGEVAVAGAETGRAERYITGSWQGKPVERPVKKVPGAAVGPDLEAWLQGNRGALYDTPVAVLGDTLVGGLTEGFGDGEWLELYPRIHFDAAGKIDTLGEAEHYDGSPGCHRLIPTLQ